LDETVESADKIAILDGDGCRDPRNEVLRLAARLNAPVGHSFRSKPWLEPDNPHAVGMIGLLGYGGAYKAIYDANLALTLGTDFPFSEFLLGDHVKRIQIDKTRNTLDRKQRLIWHWWTTSRRPLTRCSALKASDSI
jgi:pyruvate dehydrogenase (quinone)